MKDLKNKNIIVTGATGGIGNSIVEKLNEYGANILATGTREEKLNDLKSKFRNIKVLKFDISESSKIGGEIGWINQNQISNKIFLAIRNLEIGGFSKPVITTGGIILLKINDKKKISAQIDREKETKKLISFERERLLNEYSMIYYKEVETKSYVEKF